MYLERRAKVSVHMININGNLLARQDELTLANTVTEGMAKSLSQGLPAEDRAQLEFHTAPGEGLLEHL